MTTRYYNESCSGPGPHRIIRVNAVVFFRVLNPVSMGSYKFDNVFIT